MEANHKFIHWFTNTDGGTRKPLLIAFCVLWVFSFAVVFTFSYNNANALVEQSISEKFEEVFLFYDEKIAEQAKIQELALFHLSLNDEIVAALRKVDTDQLVNLSTPIFKELNKSYFITHFYFIAPDKTVIYRAHAPQRKGDVITRNTLKQASDNNYVVSGMEFGVLGTFTLRSVKPVIVDGQLIGFIELGMEVGHVIRQTEHQFKIDIVELIDKQLIKDDIKESIYRLTGRVSDEAVVENYLTVHARNKQITELKQAKLRRMADNRGAVAEALFELDSGIAYQVRPVTDFVGNKIGMVAVFSDVSLALERRDESLQRSGIFLIIMFVGGFLIFNLVLQVVDKQIYDYQQSLHNQQRDLQETISELRDTQTQLIEKEKFAALGNLVAGVAHEVNTPIGMGVTASTFLQERVNELEQAFDKKELTSKQLARFLEESKETSQIIYTNLERAAELVSSFKQVAVDQSSDESRAFNVSQLIDEVILSLRPHLKKTRHQIQVHCDADLVIDSVPGALSQIVINLIMNSIIHGFEFIEEGEITLAISSHSNQLALTYRDNGKGINEDVIERVFEPFVTTKRAEGGTGLGMHLVYNLVTQVLNGKIHLISQPERGVSIDIQFPVNEIRTS